MASRVTLGIAALACFAIFGLLKCCTSGGTESALFGRFGIRRGVANVVATSEDQSRDTTRPASHGPNVGFPSGRKVYADQTFVNELVVRLNLAGGKFLYSGNPTFLRSAFVRGSPRRNTNSGLFRV